MISYNFLFSLCGTFQITLGICDVDEPSITALDESTWVGRPNAFNLAFWPNPVSADAVLCDGNGWPPYSKSDVLIIPLSFFLPKSSQ
jgi:hypothetical protein